MIYVLRVVRAWLLGANFPCARVVLSNFWLAGSLKNILPLLAAKISRSSINLPKTITLSGRIDKGVWFLAMDSQSKPLCLSLESCLVIYLYLTSVAQVWAAA